MPPLWYAPETRSAVYVEGAGAGPQATRGLRPLSKREQGSRTP
jgi:hypothetical protein